MERRKRSQINRIPLAALDQISARLVLERIPVPSLAIARDGSILFANQAFADMIGHSTEALLSMEFSQLFPAVPADESPIPVVRKYANQLVALIHADGSVVRARMSKSALMRDDDPLAFATFPTHFKGMYIHPHQALSRSNGVSHRHRAHVRRRSYAAERRRHLNRRSRQHFHQADLAEDT